MQDFRKVRAWQASRELTVMIYRITASFPRDERFGLTSQIRRAAISIGANIAEGCGRDTRADTQRFFQMAFGSSVELLHHLIISLDLGILQKEEFDRLEAQMEPMRKMIYAFIRRLKLAQ
jgi:four helix bundle protein